MKNNQKGFAIPIIIAAVAVLVLGGGMYIYTSNKVETPVNIPDVISNVPAPTRQDTIATSTLPVPICKIDADCKEISFPTAGGFFHEQCINGKCVIPSDVIEKASAGNIPPGVVCIMDAKMCPDGSYVGRTGPNCEFVCPIQKVTSTAKDFIEKMVIDLNLNDKVIARNLNITFPSGETRESAAYAFYPSWNINIDQYLAKNLTIYDGGDATVRGFIAYKNDSIICRRFSEVKGDNLSLNFTEVYCADIIKKQTDIFNLPPPLGNSTLRISCATIDVPGSCRPYSDRSNPTLKEVCSLATKCNTEGVNSTRSDFYLIVDGTRVKVLIDLETRLRFVMGPNETLKKWTDFYPLIQPYSDGPGGMPFGATIYGDWIDSATFKANWIKWTIG